MIDWTQGALVLGGVAGLSELLRATRYMFGSKSWNVFKAVGQFHGGDLSKQSVTAIKTAGQVHLISVAPSGKSEVIGSFPAGALTKASAKGTTKSVGAVQ